MVLGVGMEGDVGGDEQDGSREVDAGIGDREGVEEEEETLTER